MNYKGTLSNGFRYNIKGDFVDDYEFFELLGEVEDKPLTIIKIIDIIFGEKQKNNLINYIKNKEGKVKLSTMSNLVNELFDKLQKENKSIKN